MQKRKYIDVICKDCGVFWSKREDSVKAHWHGRCNKCARKEVAARPECKESSRKNGLLMMQRYGSIPNANRILKGSAGSKSPAWKGGKPKCIDCNITVGGYRATRCVKCSGKMKKGISRTQEYKTKMIKLAKKGEAHWRWKGGKCGENHLIRVSAEYRMWRKAVYERDNYTCQNCGARSKKGEKVILNADHIKPFSIYPELRLDVDNGKTLCIECHKKTDTFGWKLANAKKCKQLT